MNENTGFLHITIDFDTSHLFFPKIVIGILIFLLIVIGIHSLVKYRKKGGIGTALKSYHFFAKDFDKIKLLGTIGLLAAYFYLMNRIGRLFPNQGLGFLITSIPYMFIQSSLFVGKASVRKHLAAISITSVVTPLFAWILFGKLFFITLP